MQIRSWWSQKHSSKLFIFPKLPMVKIQKKYHKPPRKTRIMPMATFWLRTFTPLLLFPATGYPRGQRSPAPYFPYTTQLFNDVQTCFYISSQVLLRSILQSFPARYCFQPQNPLKIDQTRRRRNNLSDQKRPKTIHHLQKSKRIWITKQQLQLVSFLNITQLHMLTGL